jgi:tetratricopeptide (TPR) repeat protein/uncharacterized membrane protein (UPF0136 family)
MTDKFTQQKTDRKEVSLFFLLFLVLTVITFSPVFKAGFVNWDDDQYVVGNENIKSLEHIGKYMMEPVAGYFHPFTLLTMALDYSISGGSAHWFHIVNILIHLINIVLVFIFVQRLFEGKKWIPFITALLFAIHPLHVESVAWISERKDLLYCAFFIGGLILYLNYLKKSDVKLLIGVFFLFLMSLLSKPAAVVFPLALVAIDFYFNRLKQKRTYIEKIPFFALSIIFGFITLQITKIVGATDAVVFPLATRFFFGNYGIMMYLVKMIVPLNLCTFYPYPAANVGLPVIYYLSVFVTVGLLVLFIVSLKRRKVIAFAILFYIINLILVLQFLPAGSAIIADRYSYIPLIAPFFIIGFFFQNRIDKNNGKIPVVLGSVFVVIVLSLVVISRNQASTWKDGGTLWDQAIKACPSSQAFSNRGFIYKEEGKTQEAFDMYSKAISLDKFETDALINRANIYFNQKRYAQAIGDYSQCIVVDPRNDKAYANRGGAYLAIGKIDSALVDLNRTIELNPKTLNGYRNRGMLFIMSGKYQNAIKDYSKHMEIVPDASGETWSRIGYCYQQLGNHTKALVALNHAITISGKGNFYYLRAISLKELGETDKARSDAKKAFSLGVPVDQELVKSLGL